MASTHKNTLSSAVSRKTYYFSKLFLPYALLHWLPHCFLSPLCLSQSLQASMYDKAYKISGNVNDNKLILKNKNGESKTLAPLHSRAHQRLSILERSNQDGY